jgi:hypothetical protein
MTSGSLNVAIGSGTPPIPSTPLTLHVWFLWEPRYTANAPVLGVHERRRQPPRDGGSRGSGGAPVRTYCRFMWLARGNGGSSKEGGEGAVVAIAVGRRGGNPRCSRAPGEEGGRSRGRADNGAGRHVAAS